MNNAAEVAFLHCQATLRMQSRCSPRALPHCGQSGRRRLPFFICPGSRLAYAQLGKSDEAWRCISEALTLIEQSDQRSTEAEVHRVAGEITLASGLPDEKKAEEHFAYALAVARQQQAKSWELRAAMSLARLWRDQRKGQQARELLAPVYEWFTEGFDTRDLKEAKALLDALA